MRLIDNAGRIWHRLWSIRFQLASIVLSAAYAGWEAWRTGEPPVIVLVTIGLSASSIASRLVAQPKLKEGVDG